jgi:hypothetical protein
MIHTPAAAACSSFICAERGIPTKHDDTPPVSP